MLGNTLIVIALAIITTIILHLVMTRVLRVHTRFTARERFTHFRACPPQRPIILPNDTHTNSNELHDVCRLPTEQNRVAKVSFSSDPSQTDTINNNTPDNHTTQTCSNNVQSLEDELKQWMQRESTNWAESSVGSSSSSCAETTEHQPSENHTSSAMSTSLDQVFQEQEVNLKNVSLPTLKTDVPATPNKHSKVSYTNTMNSGDLGDGLSAFDGTDCVYASFV